MKQEIINHIDDPAFLEKLYRSNKSLFRESFMAISPEVQGKPATEFWKERLSYDGNSISWGSKQEFLFIFIGCLVAGLIARIPFTFEISSDYFYPRNVGFVVFPVLIGFFAWRNQITRNHLGILAGILSIFALYINLLPDQPESDTLILACLHLPILMWVILGTVYSKNQPNRTAIPLDFLRFNGDALVMSALLGISGAILSGITFGLFSLIGIQIEPFFQKYIVVFGLPAIPILATFLTQTNPQLVNKVSPIIAKLFSPAVLIMLLIYLTAIIYTGKDPYNDRDFLMTFNILLIGVMALIFFSVAENTHKKKAGFDIWILFLLSIVTIVVNGVALSAIIFRISEWGISPNRMAVLGANILILIHLLIVTFQLFKSIRNLSELKEVGKSIVTFIPIYFVWCLLVVFIFPMIFSFQ